jgi:hypothetical protein
MASQVPGRGGPFWTGIYRMNRKGGLYAIGRLSMTSLFVLSV